MKKSLPGPVLASVLVGALVAGCGGDASSPSQSPGPATSATGADPAPTSSPTLKPAPDPTAAVGELVELDGVTFRLPEDYRVARSISGQRFSAERRGSVLGDPISVIVIDSLGLIYPLRKLARMHNNGSLYSMDPDYLAPVTIAGQEWYHLEGKVRSLAWAAAYGFNDAERAVDLAFQFSTDVPMAKRRSIVDSVLASIELT